VFGLGGESVSVAQSAITARWFKGAEVATAFGIALSFSRIGSAANFDISPSVAGNVCTNSAIDMYAPLPILQPFSGLNFEIFRYTNPQCVGAPAIARWDNHIGDCAKYAMSLFLQRQIVTL
jgi:hypothetical protein